MDDGAFPSPASRIRAHSWSGEKDAGGGFLSAKGIVYVWTDAAHWYKPNPKLLGKWGKGDWKKLE
jgi:hypothetical protein